MIATLDRPLVSEQEESTEFPAEFQSDVAEVCKMLADQNRLRIVFFLLREPELNVTEICNRLSQSQPAVSHHLSLLKQARLLQVRRDGKHNFYSLCRNRFQSVMVRLFASMLDPSTSEIRFDEFLLTHAPISENSEVPTL